MADRELRDLVRALEQLVGCFMLDHVGWHQSTHHHRVGVLQLCFIWIVPLSISQLFRSFLDPFGQYARFGIHSDYGVTEPAHFSEAFEQFMLGIMLVNAFIKSFRRDVANHFANFDKCILVQFLLVYHGTQNRSQCNTRSPILTNTKKHYRASV